MATQTEVKEIQGKQSDYVKSPIPVSFLVETFISCGSETLLEAMGTGKSGKHCETLFHAIQFTHMAQNELTDGKVSRDTADVAVEVLVGGLQAMEALEAFS